MRRWTSAALGVGLVLLSAVDGFLTVYACRLGAVELNPVMAWALARGEVFFLCSKLAISALSTALAFWLLDVRRRESTLATLCGLYACVALYEILMLSW